ncbi:MAG: Gfo/Idh/MocA family oxidoreductase, partial [Phycisphaerales bacterium]|nr:Gfo/Idh/MocA family oxidoreductase [Phycisphaerales bacterium]
MNKPINVALYGQNGHQVQRMLVNHPHARLTATAAITTDELAKAGHDPAAIYKVDTLEQLLQLKDVDVVSLCSPVRGEQAKHAIQCLLAGKHVYAEKPCALSESELDAILAAAKSSGRVFHEMAGTVLSSRYYLAVRQAVLEGLIGTVVQVNAEKSYPWSENRPKDETTDGGLIRWVAVHAFRMVEHTTG